jgi:hypothetical protein
MDLVLEKIQNVDLQYGAWINVMGITGEPRSSHAINITKKNHTGTQYEVDIQATLVWNAGPLNVQDYEQALEARNQADTTS